MRWKAMRRGVRMSGCAPDLTGQRFGRLVVVAREGSTPKRQATWRCACDCGAETVVLAKNLRCGNTRSCGCNRARAKHGHARKGNEHPLYKTWATIRRRCDNLRDSVYAKYGAEASGSATAGKDLTGSSLSSPTWVSAQMGIC